MFKALSLLALYASAVQAARDGCNVVGHVPSTSGACCRRRSQPWASRDGRIVCRGRHQCWRVVEVAVHYGYVVQPACRGGSVWAEARAEDIGRVLSTPDTAVGGVTVFEVLS